MSQNTLTVCDGPAGTGKSFIANHYVLEQLLSGQIDKVLISRAMVCAGNSGKDFASLPGSVTDKLEPYMAQYIYYLETFLDKQKIKTLIDQGKLEFTPIELLRGRNYGYKDSPAIILLDEAQNCTPKQLRLFISRLGQNSRAIIVGDHTQTDLLHDNGMDFMINKLDFSDLNDVGVVRLTYQDIQRNPIVGRILEKFEKFGINQG